MNLRGSSTFEVLKNRFFLHISNLEVIRNVPHEENRGIHFSQRAVIERPSRQLAVLPRASAIVGRAVTLSSKTNIEDLLELYCRVFSEVL